MPPLGKVEIFANVCGAKLGAYTLALDASSSASDELSVKVVAALTVALCDTPRGASLTEATVMLTVASADSSEASDGSRYLYENEA